MIWWRRIGDGELALPDPADAEAIKGAGAAAWLITWIVGLPPQEAIILIEVQQSASSWSA